MADDHPLTRSPVAAIVPYDVEPGAGVNLSNNASLHPVSPAVEDALFELGQLDVRQYPDLSSRPLRTAISDLLGVTHEQVVTANGSNDVIDLVIRAFVEPGTTVAYAPPTFGMFDRAIRINGGHPVAVPLEDDWGLPVEALIDVNARLTLIASPNNPTGNAYPLEDIRRIVEGTDGIVLVDEAYVEFHDENALGLLGTGDVLVTRTFSKAYGLAACRAGYAVAPPSIASALAKVRGPFRLNAVSERLCLAAIQDQEHLASVVEDVREQRQRMFRETAKLGLDPSPSDANFILCRHPKAAAVADALADRGYLVRAFGSPPLDDRFRFTVGPADVNDGFLDALTTVVAEVPP